MGSWSAIIGARASEKPRAATSVARALSAAGVSVGGFVQAEVLDARGQLAGWDVQSLSGERIALARRSPAPTICDYTFEPAAFERARELALTARHDVIVIGGIGKLEAAGLGHFAVLQQLVTSERAPHVIACIRDSVLSTIALALPDPVTHVTLPCGASELEAFADRVHAALKGATTRSC